jgi:hypothetical protein
VVISASASVSGALPQVQRKGINKQRRRIRMVDF